MSDARSELLALVLEVSFERRKVVLASGRESDFYLDLRQTLMRPRGVALAGALALERLRAGAAIEAVGGMAVGAVPFVSAVLAAANDHSFDDSYAYEAALQGICAGSQDNANAVKAFLNKEKPVFTGA